jgi:hypothetical protein
MTSKNSDTANNQTAVSPGQLPPSAPVRLWLPGYLTPSLNRLLGQKKTLDQRPSCHTIKGK